MSKDERISLRSARMMRGITQAEMAKKLGVHRNTYANWEENPEDISMKKADEICTILNLTADDIIFFKPEVYKM